LELVQRLGVAAPSVRVLGSTLALQPEHEQLWALGLAGLVLKHECGNAVGVAVRAVAQGWRVVTPGARALVGNEANPRVWVLRSAALPDDLPPHLQRVAYLRYVRQLTPDQIAEELVLSPNTVESYLKIIKSALHLDGRTQLLTRGFVAVTHGAEENAPLCPLTV
jgi:DNA-binding NarL/FixJ family response regulator